MSCSTCAPAKPPPRPCRHQSGEVCRERACRCPLTLRLGTRRSALATTQSTWVADLLRARATPSSSSRSSPRATPRRLALLDRRHRRLRRRAASRAARRRGRPRRALAQGPSDHARARPGRRRRPGPRGPARRARSPATAARSASCRRGAVVGTGSPRRVAQLAALGLGLSFKDIRGNVDTRIGLVRDGALDGVVLARAGLARLGRLDDVTEAIDPLQMLPAPGQGALAVECRAALSRPQWQRIKLLFTHDATRLTRASSDARRTFAPCNLLGPARSARQDIP